MLALGWRSDRFVPASPLGFPISCFGSPPSNKTESSLLPTVARAIVPRVRSVMPVLKPLVTYQSVGQF